MWNLFVALCCIVAMASLGMLAGKLLFTNILLVISFVVLFGIIFFWYLLRSDAREDRSGDGAIPRFLAFGFALFLAVIFLGTMWHSSQTLSVKLLF